MSFRGGKRYKGEGAGCAFKWEATWRAALAGFPDGEAVAA